MQGWSSLGKAFGGRSFKSCFFGWTAHEKTLTIDNLVIQGPILVKCCCIYKCGWETDTHLLILIHLVISLVIVELLESCGVLSMLCF